LLRFDGRPAYLKDEQVEEIQRLLSYDTSPEVITEKFNGGEPIHIIYGPLAGLSGEVVTCRGNKKLMVRIEQLGNSLMVELPAGCVQACKRA
jgi:transcription antitermination factor NusG